MTEKINDGGRAFPHGLSQDGMTLRDYFAAKAMEKLLTADSVWVFEITARQCYQMADAMIAEREKGGAECPQ